MTTMTPFIRDLSELGLSDLALVGGKAASLGELSRLLDHEDVTVPPGFAITAEAYRQALGATGAAERLGALLTGLDIKDVAEVSRRARAARAIVHEVMGGKALAWQIRRGFRRLRVQAGRGTSFAVRSSATAEDLPEASFAGQHESFLHVRGENAVLEAVRRCFASLFTERAIVYRAAHGFDPMSVAMSVTVMAMVRADRGVSGVSFTLDPETGFRDVVLTTAAYGLGEGLVQGRIEPDEYYVHKPSFLAGARAVLRRRLGRKAIRVVHGQRGLEARTNGARLAGRYCLADADVLALSSAAIAIEARYSQLHGRPTPMDIEWAKDGRDGRLYILQARPETAAARRVADDYATYSVAAKTPPLVEGRAVGEGAASGVVHPVRGGADLAAFKRGEVMVARTTRPDWLPAMTLASAIVTDEGGTTCHAAIVARELGVPAIVGAGKATTRLKAGAEVTVSCAEGEIGRVYDGLAPIKVERLSLSRLPRPRTPVMLNLAQPDLAFKYAGLPSGGVGLARLEFIIGQLIGIHPMAAAHPERLPVALRKTLARRARADGSPREHFVRVLSEGVGAIAAAFHPRPVIARLSDFKTNEYAALLGGQVFEPKEENPMLGFRGAARYDHPLYADGFALECEALTRVRQIMGLKNLRLMIPFCRRVGEAQAVLAALARHGLVRGQDGLEVWMMCEIPNNVIQIDAFAPLFDGFSIGSNDLTQLVLGVDRDSGVVAFDFDEQDPGVVAMLRQAIDGARRNRLPIGVCGEAPATYPDLAALLVRAGVSSLSVNPASLARTLAAVSAAEARPAALAKS